MDTRRRATVIIIEITFSSNISWIAVAGEVVNSVDAITFGQKKNDSHKTVLAALNLNHFGPGGINACLS